MHFKMTLTRFAADVALTLTDVAKVWFAEIHWTPGLLESTSTSCRQKIVYISIGSNRKQMFLLCDLLLLARTPWMMYLLWQLAWEKFKAVL